MRRASLTVAILLAALSTARADWHGDVYTAPAVQSFDARLEARGCTWYRQRQTCGRYCYTEVNGKRYCQEREHDAHPQAPLGEATIFDQGYSVPMK